MDVTIEYHERKKKNQTQLTYKSCGRVDFERSLYKNILPPVKSGKCFKEIKLRSTEAGAIAIISTQQEMFDAFSDWCVNI